MWQRLICPGVAYIMIRFPAWGRTFKSIRVGRFVETDLAGKVKMRRLLGAAILAADMIAYGYLVSTYGGVFLTGILVFAFVTEMLALFQSEDAYGPKFVGLVTLAGLLASVIVTGLMTLRVLVFFAPMGLWAGVFTIMVVIVYALARVIVVREA